MPRRVSRAVSPAPASSELSKLTAARARIAKAKELSGGSVCVAFSGGKDSLVILDLLKQQFDRVECFHMYLVRGLRCVEEPLERYAKRWNVKIHYVPHWARAMLMRNADLSHTIKEAVSLPRLKQRDVENYLAKQTGITWFAYGERASDSFVRRFYTRDNDGVRIRGKTPKLYPIWDWVDADVYAYMRARKIPPPTRFGRDSKMSSISLRDETMLWLRETHPEDFRTVCRSFPFLEAMLPK